MPHADNRNPILILNDQSNLSVSTCSLLALRYFVYNLAKMSFSTRIPEEPIAKWRQSTYQARSPTSAPIQHSIYGTLDKTKREIRICDLTLSPELSAPLECILRIV